MAAVAGGAFVTVTTGATAVMIVVSAALASIMFAGWAPFKSRIRCGAGATSGLAGADMVSQKRCHLVRAGADPLKRAAQAYKYLREYRCR